MVNKQSSHRHDNVTAGNNHTGSAQFFQLIPCILADVRVTPMSVTRGLVDVAGIRENSTVAVIRDVAFRDTDNFVVPIVVNMNSDIVAVFPVSADNCVNL